MKRISLGIRIAGMLTAVGVCLAQPPEQSDDRDGRSATGDSQSFVTQMMTFDANKDGSIARTELTDSRLKALFARADADHNNIGTAEELTKLYQTESSASQDRSREGWGGPGSGPPPGDFGPGGPGGGGPGGDGRRMGGRPQPGEILPGFMRESLQLTPEQVKELDALQAEVNQRLAKILTQQQQELMKNRGPGGPPPGGPGQGEPARRRPPGDF